MTQKSKVFPITYLRTRLILLLVFMCWILRVILKFLGLLWPVMLLLVALLFGVLLPFLAKRSVHFVVQQEKSTNMSLLSNGTIGVTSGILDQKYRVNELNVSITQDSYINYLSGAMNLFAPLSPQTLVHSWSVVPLVVPNTNVHAVKWASLPFVTTNTIVPSINAWQAMHPTFYIIDQLCCGDFSSGGGDLVLKYIDTAIDVLYDTKIIGTVYSSGIAR